MAREKFTAGRVACYECDIGKQQSFLWDKTVPSLAVRATANGAKAYIYQGKLSGKDIRITIGSPSMWAIDAAQAEARRLQVMVDKGQDPRQVRDEAKAAAQAARDAKAASVAAVEQTARRNQITVREVWEQYIEARRAKWGERHLYDHRRVIQAACTKGKDGATRTLTAAVLASLAPLALSELTPERIGLWLEEETPHRATQAALAFRLLRAFINWCNERAKYKGIAAPDSCARKVSREHLPKAGVKRDALQREQLRLWFDAVQRIPNPTISVYLQGLLITGARRNELTGLRWEQVDFSWNSLGGVVTKYVKISFYINCGERE
jgi:hypothetical protein